MYRINLKSVLFFLLLFLADSHFAQSSFTAQVWVKTTAETQQFPSIMGNKIWDGGKIVDFTSNHNFGQSLDSGAQHGWTFAVQANGAWTWNIGDGEKRLDYLPTAERQRINDGEWHHLACTFEERKATASLYFDGQMVAIYSLNELEKLNYKDLRRDSLVFGNSQIEIDTFAVDGRKMSRFQVATAYRMRSGKSIQRVRPRGGNFKLLNWNIWHGGRKDGNEKGLKKTIQIIRESEADLVSMQETYGSGPVIADSLGMVYYYRSSNLGVFSKYPIIATHDLYKPFHFGGVTLQMPGRKQLRVFSLWLNYLPDIDKSLAAPWSVDSILSAESQTRQKEITAIITDLDLLLKETDEVPIIVAGDFNSPSHLDFTEVTKARYQDLIIPWPVSKAMLTRGFKDAFRLIHKDPSLKYGATWSPRFEDSCQERIDHIYFTPGLLKCVDAQVLNQAQPQWPSDHAAVLAEFRLIKWKD